MPTSASETPPAATVPDFGALARSADERLAALIEQLDRDATQAAATATHLRHLLAEQRAHAPGLYRVFECEPTAQLIVLRDVAAVDGARRVYETESFAAALAWMNERLAARCAAGNVATRYDDPRPAAPHS